jgi:hypothetical protein
MTAGYDNSQYEIPQSRGMPPVVRYLFGVGVVIIFFMGFISIYYAHEFHVWPESQTIRVPLSGSF